MMDNFSDAFDTLMFFETPKFENDPRDVDGGPTKFGITIPYLQLFYQKYSPEEHATKETICALTLERVRIIYKAMTWKPLRIAEIVDLTAATLVLLAATNLGPYRAVRGSQRALRAAGHPVKIDGQLGPITLAATNEGDPLVFCAAMRSEISGVYRAIVRYNPQKQWALAGWLNRANWLY